MPKRALPQHWLRPENEPQPYWCPLCKCPVSKWHEHHSPRKKRTWKPRKKWRIANA